VDQLDKMNEENFNTIDMLSTRVQTMEAEKKFMEEQVKASKRQNKLLVMALNKQEGNQAGIEQDIENIHNQHVEIRKQQVNMPDLQLNPFTSVENASQMTKGRTGAAGLNMSS